MADVPQASKVPDVSKALKVPKALKELYMKVQGT